MSEQIGFNPITSEDYVAPLQESYKQINEGMDNYWAQESSNYKRSAEIAGQDLKSLADMSGTLGKYFAKKDEEKRVADRAKGYMWMQENGIDPGQVQSFKEAEAAARAEGVVINEEIFNWEQQGGDIWTSETFRKMNASEKLGAVTAWSQQRAAQYNPAEATKGAATYEEYNAALTNYRLNFYKQFGDINPAILNEYVFGTVRKADSTNYSEWYATREAEIKANRTEKYQTELEACIRGGNGTSCVFNYQTSQTINGMNKGESTRDAFKVLKEMAKNKTLTKELYVQILAENKEFEHAGRNNELVKFNEEFFEDLQEIEQEIETAEINDFNRSESLKKISNSKEYTELVNTFEWTDFGLHPDAINKLTTLRSEQRRRNGFSHPQIDDAIRDFGHKENYYKDRKKDLTEAIMNGEVWSAEDAIAQGYEMPVYMDKNVQDLFKNVQNARFDYEKQAGYIEDLILSQAGVTNETKSDEVSQLIDYFKDQLKRNMISAAIAQPDNKNIGSEQYQILKNAFISDIENPDSSKSIFRPKGKWKAPTTIDLSNIPTIQSDNKAIIQTIDKLTNKGFKESVMTANSFFSPEQLIQYGEDYSKGTFIVPARANYIARRFGYKGPDGELLTGLDVINYAREAVDLEPLEKPDAISNLEKLDSLSIDELTYNKTDASLNRVIGKNVEVVPELNNSIMHPLIKEWLTENSHQSNLKGGLNLSLEGFWDQSRLLENRLKEEFPDEAIHGAINQIKKETTDLYKKEKKEGGVIHGLSSVDKEQWRRKKYLELLYNKFDQKQIDDWVGQLEKEEVANTNAELEISMDFLSAYEFDFTNVPLELDGGFSPFDQNRYLQLGYKHTGSLEFLEALKRPSFMNTNE